MAKELNYAINEPSFINTTREKKKHTDRIFGNIHLFFGEVCTIRNMLRILARTERNQKMKNKKKNRQNSLGNESFRERAGYMRCYLYALNSVTMAK